MAGPLPTRQNHQVADSDMLSSLHTLRAGLVNGCGRPVIPSLALPRATPNQAPKFQVNSQCLKDFHSKRSW